MKALLIENDGGLRFIMLPDHHRGAGFYHEAVPDGDHFRRRDFKWIATFRRGENRGGAILFDIFEEQETKR